MNEQAFPEAVSRCTVEHAEPMLSLYNTDRLDGLRGFDAGVQRALDWESPSYVVSAKVDGVSISLEYDDGRFVRASTRGGGHCGVDVTEMVRQVAHIPMALEGCAPEHIELRGEMFMRRKVWKLLNRRRKRAGLRPFASARHATAATLNSEYTQSMSDRELHFMAFGIAGLELPLRDTFDWLVRFGAEPVPYEVCETIEEAIDVCAKWRKTRKLWSFDTDGLVIAIDSECHRKILGCTARAPRWAMAFKF